MTVGVVMLVHADLDRAAQVALHWASHDCPVVIHVDKKVDDEDHKSFLDKLSTISNITFSPRRSCEWGTWSLVAASQDAAQLLLDSYEKVRHVYLASGSCLPLRPIAELKDYLAKQPMTNFIESVTIKDVRWTVGGLSEERFTLRFPYSWKKQRWLFDRYVSLQRLLRIKRKVPEGLAPHMGSQWWCLTRQTLTAMFSDPNRERYERYFKRVWIPDESYYQTLVRLYSDAVESRSLTLSKFDFQGKPHIFYDDHLQLLRRSDCFVARKIWPRANRIYDTFLNDKLEPMKGAEPNPGKIDRIFSKAVERRVMGRDGLYMQSRMPAHGKGHGKTCAPYSVFAGFSDLFVDFDKWLERAVGARVHGHLFGPDGVEFSGRQQNFSGGLSRHKSIRDYNPTGFLTSLIWNTRGERQCFMHSPRDNQEINWLIALDPNAQISVVTGAWAVPLLHSNWNFSDIREEAARLQKIETESLEILRSHHVKARVRIWTLADFIDSQLEPLQGIIDEIGARSARRLTEAPTLCDLTGFTQFIQNLKNQGMNPHLVGDFQSTRDASQSSRDRKRPYLVK